jgi:hypothetical protein
MIDFTEKLKQGRLAALHVAVWGIVLSVFVAIAVGFFFAESDDALLRRAHFAVAAIGIAFTGVIVYRILTGDITEHHYRERLRAEKDAERINAEIAELEARRALYAAKERAIWTPLPARTLPRIEASQPAQYVNNERIDTRIDHQPVREEIVSEPMGDDDDELMAPSQLPPALEPVAMNVQTSAPYRSAGKVIHESEQVYDLRMHRLAREIYDLCRDVNPPTQADIKERIPLTTGGLLRSNDDITRALNILARRGLVEPEKGQGITRYWLDGQGRPLPRTPRKKAITSNVRVERA